MPFAGKLTAPECVREYFEDFFWKNEDRMDEDGIIENLCRPAQSGNIQFKDIAQFQMIESATIPIVIALEEMLSNWYVHLNLQNIKEAFFGSSSSLVSRYIPTSLKR